MSGFFTEWPAGMRAVFVASGYGAVLALVVFGVQVGLRRVMPARVAFALWVLVLIRLSVIPLPASRVSLFNVLERPGGTDSSRETGVPAAHAGEAEDPVRAVAVARATAALAGTSPAESVARKMPASSAASSVPLPALARADRAGAELPVRAAAGAPVAAAGRERISVGDRLPVPVMISVVYLGVAGLLLMRMAAAGMALRRIIGRATAVTDGRLLRSLEYARRAMRLRRRMGLRVTEDLDSPAVAGIVRPCILLPRELSELLSDEELHFVFLHECAHVRRGDVVLNCWWAILRAVHWFNPAVWLLSPRIRADRELACDELVLGHTRDGAGYGRALLRILELLGAGRPSPAAVGMIESRKAFFGRIRMIASYRRKSRWAAVVSAAVFLAAGCAGLTNGEGTASAPAGSKAAGTAAAAPWGMPAPVLERIYKDRGDWVASLAQPGATGVMYEMRVGGTWQWNGFTAKAITADTLVITDGKSERTVHVGEAIDGAPVPAAKAAGAAPGEHGGSAAWWTPEQLQGFTAVDPTLDGLVHARVGAEKTYQERLARLGPKNEATLDAQKAMDAANQQVNARLAAFSGGPAVMGKPAAARAMEMAGAAGRLPSQMQQQLLQLALDVSALSSQLGALKAEPMASPAEISAAVASLNAAQQRLAGQAMDLQARAAGMVGGQTAALDGIGKLFALVGVPDGGAALAGSQDPVMDSLVITRNSLEQEKAAEVSIGDPPYKTKELGARIAVIDGQIENLKNQRAEEAARAAKEVAAAQPAAATAQNMVRKEFEVRDLIGVPEGDLGALTADERAAAQDLVATLSKLCGGAQISAFNGTLVVRGTGGDQQAIQGVLDDLREQAHRREELRKQMQKPATQGNAAPAGQGEAGEVPAALVGVDASHL